MSDIKWTLEPDDIEWEMDWASMKRANPNSEEIQATPDKEAKFEEAPALAHLLMNEVIFLNDHWWEKEWPEQAREITSLNVNCNDVFAWGCADAEELPYKEVENLYRMWRKDPAWGPAVWCMIQRNQMPQPPVEKLIRKAGIWDLEKLGLGKNTMDDECKAYLAAVIAHQRENSGNASTTKEILP